MSSGRFYVIGSLSVILPGDTSQRGKTDMNGHLDPLNRAQKQLLQHLSTPKVLCKPRAEEDDVGGNRALRFRSDRFHFRDDDVEYRVEFVDGEDEHLIERTAIPFKRIDDSFFVLLITQDV